MSSLITLCNGSGDHPVQLVKELQIGLTVENETLDGKVDLITRIKCPITESKNEPEVRSDKSLTLLTFNI